ncbi:glycerol kinase GlpK [Deinococcus roseus]|uniref:Glycerol kinase n=1 Tax=Deinococcus roseus TaxID=392414 RepID=A0ABQ2D1V3_9DEIO|nr:glycerol kinase GlpK [Deinococcus roseus]GGJ39744.1 glycerol kinase [Deinococcus roseus]
MKYILALDQGTTSCRAIVFDHEGTVRGTAQKEFQQFFPRPGWVEHDAQDIYSTQVGVTSEVLAHLGLSGQDIAAIGITNQRETTVLWDRASGQPIAHAIVWQDRRTAGRCDELRQQGKTEVFQQKTGLVLDAYFSGTKLEWLLNNTEGARERAAKGELAFGTIDCWLLWKLTGGKVHVTDPSNAARTLLFNIHTGDWDDELLSILNIPRALLPEVKSSSEVYGQTLPHLFGGEIPIAGIAGDQQAATFGQACHEVGMAKNTYGTGCFLLLNTGQEAIPSQNHLLTTVAWKREDQLTYALEGSVFMAGATVQWLRDGLGIIRDSSEVESLAASVESTDGVYLVPAFVGLGAPYWDPYARGSLFGMTRGTTRAHIARAALESICFQTADVLHAMQEDSGITLTELRVDGGASRNNLMMQFQADILGVPVVRPKVTETTALGAAYLAGLAVGFWSGLQDISQQWQADERFEPNMSATTREKFLAGWKKAVDRARNWEDA